MPPEMVVQAETRFSESPFVQECLEWHNNYRRKHLAPDLTLDPPVSTFILVYSHCSMQISSTVSSSV